MKTFMFPGQGSQARGMGGNVFDEFPGLTQQADELLGYSIRELCVEDPRQELGKTQFTQPALYVVNALSHIRKMRDGGEPPDFLVGHSLGEFNALQAAGCFSFEVGLSLVKKRAELMSKVSGGAMAAVMNATKEEIEASLSAAGLKNIDLANYNTPAQIVISGSAAEIARAQELFQRGKTRYYPLNTSGAFHSRFMAEAMKEFAQYLQTVEFSEPGIPVISNVTALPYRAQEMRQTLAEQIVSTVRWCESIQYLQALGTAPSPMKFEEIGYGEVLTRLVRTIQQLTPPKYSAVTAEEKIAAWNAKYPIGTFVKSTTARYGQLETRTQALVLFGHRAAVYMKGYNGYFDLDELLPA